MKRFTALNFHLFPKLVQFPWWQTCPSHILSRVIDVSRYDVIFACAQKNLGNRRFDAGHRA